MTVVTTGRLTLIGPDIVSTPAYARTGDPHLDGSPSLSYQIEPLGFHVDWTDRESYSYRATFRGRGSSLTVRYHMGTGLARIPEAREVLESVLNDVNLDPGDLGDDWTPAIARGVARYDAGLDRILGPSRRDWAVALGVSE